DGLDHEDMISLHEYFSDRTRVAFGWGTLLTNDFRGCHPRGFTDLDPISLVCKLTSVGLPTPSGETRWAPAVKLSDNYTKATGPKEEIARYRESFGTSGVANAPVTV